jgi:hypothetical protein
MNNKYFPYILAFAAFFIAANAAFFSITGLSHLYSGAFWSVVIMASSLELGKLVSASFLYRYWYKISKFWKSYLVSGTILLMIITSIGIYGYLSKAYQGATLDLNKLNNQIVFQEEEVDRLVEEKQFLTEQMTSQIESLPDNYPTAKRKIRDDYVPIIRELSLQISETKSKLSELTYTLFDVGADVGPILYVAKSLGTDIDTVVKWLTLLLIVVFDPLAVALIVATNISLYGREEERSVKVKKQKKPEPEPEKKVIKKIEIIEAKPKMVQKLDKTRLMEATSINKTKYQGTGFDNKKKVNKKSKENTTNSLNKRFRKYLKY